MGLKKKKESVISKITNYCSCKYHHLLITALNTFSERFSKCREKGELRYSATPTNTYSRQTHKP